MVPQTQTPQAETISAEDVAIYVVEMESWFQQLRRALAGFTTLQAALAGATGNVKEGERKKALPVFEFSASLVGAESREALKCAIDLKNLNPQYVPHVLIPIVNAFAAELLEAADEIGTRIDSIRPTLQRVASGQT